jgi:hypothetical protein
MGGEDAPAPVSAVALGATWLAPRAGRAALTEFLSGDRTRRKGNAYAMSNTNTSKN